MKHRIETNVPARNVTDIERVRAVVLRKVEDDQMGNVYVCSPTGSNIVVEITGNGALLRDAAFALDVAGMLD